MQKAKWNIVFALLAAFALVFAAGCDNSGDSDYAKESAAKAISAGDVEELFKSIGELVGRDGYYVSSCCWDFSNGTLDADSAIFTVKWVKITQKGILNPEKYTTLTNMTKVKASTDLLAVDFSNASWDTDKTQAEPGSSELRYITASVSLAEGASGYEFPQSLKTITIAFDPNENVWSTKES